MAKVDMVESRKQQIARRLRVSERVLEQYLRSKQAEVEGAPPAHSSKGLDARPLGPVEVEQRRSDKHA